MCHKVSMYIEDFFEDYKDKKVKMFVDMDGVIVDYVVGEAANYHKKRPLFSVIQKLENLSNRDNIELYILSVSRMDEGVGQKNEWLDKYAPFFKKENRVIISRESNDFKSSPELKSTYINDIERGDFTIIVVDDDPRVLSAMKHVCSDVVLLKDTAFVD